MVQFIQRPKSFGDLMAEGIGQGANASVQQMQQLIMQSALEKQKQNRLQTFLNPTNQSQTGSKLQGKIPENKIDFSQMSSRQRIQLANEFPEVAREIARQEDIGVKREKLELQKEAPEREYQAKQVHEVLDRVKTSKENLIQRRTDYRIAEAQLKQSPNDIGSLKNFIADSFNLPGLKSAPAAAFSSVMKDAYVQSLKQIPGMRPNQWIEQVIQTAMARVGQSDEANQNILDIGNFKLDLEEEYNNIVDGLRNYYESQGQKIPSSIGDQAYKSLLPFAEERQKELAYDMRVNFEKETGMEKLSKLKHVPTGTPLTIEMAEILKQKTGGDEKKAIKLAESLGYEIPNESFFRKRGYITE